jgi:hypothetical protein
MGQLTDLACLDREFFRRFGSRILRGSAHWNWRKMRAKWVYGRLSVSQPKEGWFHVKATVSCAADTPPSAENARMKVQRANLLQASLTFCRNR